MVISIDLRKRSDRSKGERRRVYKKAYRSGDIKTAKILLWNNSSKSMDSSSDVDFDFIASSNALHLLEVFPNAKVERRSKKG